MKLERLTLLRPNMGDYRSSDAMPPLAIAVLAARTPADVDIRFFDDRVEAIPANDCPDLVAMSVETFTARRAYELAAAYRERGVPVVMGGYHPSLLPDEALGHCDAIVVGDAEGCWESLLEDFRAGRMRRIYRGGGDEPAESIRFDRRLFQGKRYAPVELVQFGRGCRYACDFCSIRAFYPNGPRSRPIAGVIEEIRTLNPRRLFFFVDDNLFSSEAQLRSLCRALKPLGLRWSCQISIDVARNDELLALLAESGCIFVLIGFESLSPENLRQMGKSWNTVAGDYRQVVRKFHMHGMAVYGTFVFGYDTDRIDDIRRCLDFALEEKLEMANFNPLTPTPTTPLYRRLMAEGRMLSPQWWLDSRYRYGDPTFRPSGMDPEAFAEACFEAKRAFYSWGSICRRVLGSDAGLDWFRSGMAGLVNIISRREVMRKQHRLLGE